MKLLFRDLNFNFYPSHLTSIYVCEVTIIPRVCGNYFNKLLSLLLSKNFRFEPNNHILNRRGKGVLAPWSFLKSKQY